MDFRAVNFHFGPNRVFSWIKLGMNETMSLGFFRACSRVHGVASFRYETTSFLIRLKAPLEKMKRHHFDKMGHTPLEMPKQCRSERL
jgi:hypothetical protein